MNAELSRNQWTTRPTVFNQSKESLFRTVNYFTLKLIVAVLEIPADAAVTVMLLDDGAT